MISNELLLLGLAPGPEPFPVNPGDGANKRRRGTGLVAAFPIPRRSGSEPPSSFLRFVFFFFRRLLIAPGTLVVPGGRTVPFGVMRRDSTDNNEVVLPGVPDSNPESSVESESISMFILLWLLLSLFLPSF